ncbi:Acetylcholinesterase [Nymphon striatum]|nr:Acetylcholinesterase [Nymphon striatum]
MMTHRGKRSGLSLHSILFLNAHGIRTALASTPQLAHHSIAFFSETWDPTSSPLITDKDFFSVAATKPPGRGRPYGGLHMYVNPTLNAKLLSSNDSHISIQLKNISIIGFYFRPGTDLDDILISLATELNNVPSDQPTILGGDLNLHPDSSNFKEVCNFLRPYNISVISNTSIPTYVYTKGSSCIDYVFASSPLHDPSVHVLNYSCSDHFPLQLKLRLRRNGSQLTKNLQKLHLDFESAIQALGKIDSSQPPDKVVQSVNNILQKCVHTFPQKSSQKSSRKAWFTHHLRSLRSNCLHLRHLSTLDPSFTRDYCVARTAYHKGIRYAKAAYLHKKSEMLIINAKELGIKALHRDIKIRTPSSSISIHSLFDHCKDLFISDNPLPSEFTQIPSCERKNHPLLYPYSLQEIKAVLLRVKSKACSLSGYLSPLSLKLLLPGIAPILHTLFNHFLSNSDFPSCCLFISPIDSNCRHSSGEVVDSEMVFLQLFVLLCSVAVIKCSTNSESVTLHTVSGPIKGKRQSTLDGQVDSFLGIPYAKPPINDLRFRRPAPVERWCDVRDATNKPNACTQYPAGMFGPGFKGEQIWVPNTQISEDCLYLNVWAPAKHANRLTSLTPVFVWIYGGGFNSGSSDLDLYDGALIAARNNLIVVSFNYRTGVFGFLDVQTNEAPGNVGLLDQQLALKWVKTNIMFFGGDPERITIAGESAGSFSVNFHLLSHGSRNLFDRAIMQSGSAYNKVAVLSDKVKFEAASNLAEAANCSHKDATVFPDEIVECLRKLPSNQLNLLELGLYKIPIKYAFTPTVDGHFLPDHPMSMVDKGDFKKTDILMGTNANEGTFFLVYDFASYFSKDTSSLLTRVQAIEVVKRMLHHLDKEFTDLLIKHYFKNVEHDDKVSNRDIIGEILGDSIFLCPMNKFAEIMAESGQNVYYYHFMHRTKSNPWGPWMGVLHGDEIEYVFGRPLVKKDGYAEEEVKLSQDMMDSWSNFVRTGHNVHEYKMQIQSKKDPSLPDEDWPEYSKQNRTFKILHGTKKGFDVGPSDKRCAFWNHMLPALEQANVKRITLADRTLSGAYKSVT